MVNDVGIVLYNRSVNCDKYHLLKPDQSPDEYQDTILYTCAGKSYTGFDKPFILDTEYDFIKYCKMGYITLNGMNIQPQYLIPLPIYCTVESIKPIRNDKTMVVLQPDPWLNYRHDVKIGDMSSLFETTRLLPEYPFYEYSGKYKYFDSFQPLEQPDKINLIVVYRFEGDSVAPQANYFIYLKHDLDNDRSLYGAIFTFFSQLRQMTIGETRLDTNSILGFYISPFTVNMGTQEPVIHYERQESGTSYVPGYDIYMMNLDLFQGMQTTYFKHKGMLVVNNHRTKTCITDMTGGIVWQAEFKDRGLKEIVFRLDVEFGQCLWNGYIVEPNSGETIQVSQGRRFTIPCLSLEYFSDYFQYYMNLQRTFNQETKQAQLEKQIIDGIGDTIASSLWHGTSSATPGAKSTSPMALAGGAVGGLAQTALNAYSTREYNIKISNIEERQAKMQYDTLNATGNSPYNFNTGNTIPSVCSMHVDDETVNSNTVFGNDLIKYNCRIRGSDAEDLIAHNSYTNYIAGDFDFYNIPVDDAIELNKRFQHGIQFVDWTD